MTVSSTTSRDEYNGNGVTTSFAYTFRILDEDHVAVYVDDVLKTITTHYTVSGVGDSGGGSITMLSAPAAGTANVVFLRSIPLTQETDYVENDPFPAEAHEDALDKLTMVSQQLQEQLDRTIVLPPTSTVSNLTLPTPTAGKALLWNATEDGLENSTDDFNDIVTDATAQAAAAAASASTATTQAGLASTAKTNAETAETNAEAAQAAAEAAAATIPSYPTLVGAALKYPRLNAGETAMEFRTASQSRTDLGLAIGTDVQAYNANNAVTNAAQTFTVSQRGTATTDNDLSFDLNVTNNFTCTPTAGAALTFTNITAGQSGFIKLVNGANYAITAAATTKVTSTFLTTISATGTYICSYYSDGTNVYVATAGAMS